MKIAVTDLIFVISSQTKSRIQNVVYVRRTIFITILYNYFKGCDVVMLLDIKNETYLAGQILPGTTGSSKGIVQKCDHQWLLCIVGARKREVINGIQKPAPISGDCFWQIEKAKTQLNGDNYYWYIVYYIVRWSI